MHHRVRHRGGLYPSGSGKSQTLAKALDSSAFLSIDVVLNHMLSLSVPNSKECSVAADFLRYQSEFLFCLDVEPLRNFPISRPNAHDFCRLTSCSSGY